MKILLPFQEKRKKNLLRNRDESDYFPELHPAYQTGQNDKLSARGTPKRIANDFSTTKDTHAEKKVKKEKMDQNIMDWDRLKIFTDGDPEEEKFLIDLFITNAEETLEVIKQHVDTHDNEEWKKAVHRLKGSAANLGAKNLSDICQEAEQAYEENEETKRILLHSILASYEEVRNVLSNSQAA